MTSTSAPASPDTIPEMPRSHRRVCFRCGRPGTVRNTRHGIDGDMRLVGMAAEIPMHDQCARAPLSAGHVSHEEGAR